MIWTAVFPVLTEAQVAEFEWMRPKADYAEFGIINFGTPKNPGPEVHCGPAAIVLRPESGGLTLT